MKGVHFFLAAGQARRAVPSPRVAEKQAARRDHILDHAASIVLEDGLDALTMERLAQALGVATSALYRTFSGRAALLAGLQVRAIAALAAEVDAALAASPRGGTPGSPRNAGDFGAKRATQGRPTPSCPVRKRSREMRTVSAAIIRVAERGSSVFRVSADTPRVRPAPRTSGAKSRSVMSKSSDRVAATFTA